MEELPKIQDGWTHDSFMKVYNLLRTKQWIEDESKAMFELWGLCNSDEKKDLIVELLTRFKLINSRGLNKYCEAIACHITQSWNLTNRGTKLVAISDDRYADGSQLVIGALKNNFADKAGWNEKHFINSLKTIGEAGYQLRNNQKIILIDDFIGTGKTFISKIDWLKQQISKKNKKNIRLYVVALAAMNFAVDGIKTLVDDFYSPLILNKGISDYDPQKIDTMLELEGELANRHDGLYLPSFLRIW